MSINVPATEPGSARRLAGSLQGTVCSPNPALSGEMRRLAMTPSSLLRVFSSHTVRPTEPGGYSPGEQGSSGSVVVRSGLTGVVDRFRASAVGGPLSKAASRESPRPGPIRTTASEAANSPASTKGPTMSARRWPRPDHSALTPPVQSWIRKQGRSSPQRATEIERPERDEDSCDQQQAAREKDNWRHPAPAVRLACCEDSSRRRKGGSGSQGQGDSGNQCWPCDGVRHHSPPARSAPGEPGMS